VITDKFVPGSIVVGVDGSPLSTSAVEWAARRAHARDLPLHIVHACRNDPGAGFGEAPDRDELRLSAMAMLASAVAHAHSAAPGLHVSTACVPGFASKTLVQVSLKAAMVVVGAVGHGIISRASIGPTTLQVAMAAHCPLVIIGHEGRTSTTTHGRVVVGVDGSSASLNALTEAFDRAALRGAELHIVHATPIKSAGTGRGTNTAWPEPHGSVQDLVAERISTHTSAHPDVKVNHDLVRADPVKALYDSSREADLVIVGRRGLGGFPGLRLGSVAVRLMGRTSCPLVIAPAA
jgi:nucleotide-binding universal stress UspA family protein